MRLIDLAGKCLYDSIHIHWLIINHFSENGKLIVMIMINDNVYFAHLAIHWLVNGWWFVEVQ